ncbi:peptidoglycan recognition family protein [Niallia alba]|uniref:peptidoglycan recognition family protein n=1 Tax=Niallia alba TaxID=2729105 RepID=UPI002E2056D8|nr:peptidoglycan recognition family protein [Niallia alba]
MSWVSNKEFTNVDEFVQWLDESFGDYISKHINDNHVHHTWRPNHDSNKKTSTLQLHKNMRNYHVNTNGWDDVAQHITIGYDGVVILGRDIRKIPVSAKNYNGTTNLHPFAYEMIGDFDKGNDKLEGKQLDAAIKISRYFYKKGKGIVFHRECLINGKQPKTCPGTGIEKSWFMSLVKDSKFDVIKVAVPIKEEVGSVIIETPSKPVASSSKPITQPTPTPTKTLGLVDWMKSKGMDSGYNNRAKLAKEYGIANYSGTASQNEKLLDLLQAGKKPVTSTTKKETTSNSNPKNLGLVDWMNANKMDSSYANREKLAKQYGISGYKGTADQNIKLLEKLTSGAKVSTKTTSSPTIKVGAKVTLKSSATKYATGESIPKSIKGKKYTIQQVGSGKVLLKEIYSWVKTSDLS